MIEPADTRLASRRGAAGRVVAACLLLAASVQALAGSEARDWITRMNTAVTASNYEGVFVHKIGDWKEVLRIVHRGSDGRLNERVVSTDGSQWEQVRNGSRWVGYYPNRRNALVQTRHRSFGYIATLNGITDDAERHYRITHGGRQQLMGRSVELIQIEPLDELRYGYRLWLDSESALPRKSQRISRGGRVIEEIAFLNLTSLATVPDELLKPEVDVTGFTWMRIDVPMRDPRVTIAFSPRAELLPAGFRVRTFGSGAEQEVRGPGGRSRFIISDGISWVEVFVAKSDRPRSVEEASRAGKASQKPVAPAAGSQAVVMASWATFVAAVEGHTITVVGEAPPQTVKLIAEAFRPE